MSNPFWLLKPPNTLFTAGMVLILLAVVYMCTGKAYARFHGWIYRANDPKGYWLEVAGSFLLGVGLIGLFLYEVSN